VEPGDFFWSERNEGDSAERNPWRSMQIFEESLDFDSFETSFQDIDPSIPDPQLQATTLKGTTIDNPVYGVKAGQKVEILMFRLNSIVPTAIFLTQDVKKYTVPLAEMTQKIATSDAVLAVVNSFLEE